MTHDPLCSVQDDDLLLLQMLCICGELSAARRDMLARCIAALEADDLHDEDPSWSGTQWNNAVYECRVVLQSLQTP
jgi:hypothetical protein